MLRAATPLAVLLFVAFGLLLLSVISTPIVKPLKLGSFQGVDFGVFGYCKGSTCTPIEIGYDTSSIFSSSDSASFALPSSARNTITSILIIHPVACFLALVMFALAVAAHFHSAAHSTCYLLSVVLFGTFTFLASLLAFLVDILLFEPHNAFGTWLVLAATILILVGSIFACLMRRTLVGRKSRKRQVEENAEMSGENFYNRQAQAQAEAAAAVAVSSSRELEPTLPVISGANGPGNKPTATFATFERRDDRSSDERVPLTARSPSDRSPNAPPTDLAIREEGQLMNAPPMPPAPSRSPSIPRDQYGNPMNGPPEAYGAVRRGSPMDRMNTRGRGGMPPPGYRGRGGYGPMNRGGYGPPPGRGGYGPPNRGGPPPYGRGGYGPPPRGYPGSGRGRTPPPGYRYDRGGPYGARGASPGPPSGPPRPPSGGPGYDMVPPMPAMPAAAGYDAYNAYNPDRESDLPRAESPPPLPSMYGAPDAPAEALEMDGTPAAVTPRRGSRGLDQYSQIRDSDTDIAGMVGLQQGMASDIQRQDTVKSHASDDAAGQYIPPRAVWNNGGGSPRMPSPLNMQGRPGADFVASNSRSSPPRLLTNGVDSHGSTYYEDVDPRFADPSPRRRTPPPIQTSVPYEEDVPQGSRSPAESERSNFTSISQRGINPRWNPPPPALTPGYGGPPIQRRPVRNPNDALLNANPDFALPTGPSGPSPARGGNGMIPGSAYPAL